VEEGTIEVFGRRVGYRAHGSGTTAVLWCHGGPGSRQDPDLFADAFRELGVRLVGIDRPGYGTSVPQPGRTIAGWLPEALAVADHLGVERLLPVGVSTGGAYALALAALAPGRVDGVVACCSMTDMSYEPARATMSPRHALAVWEAADRDAAIAAAVESHGIDGSKLFRPQPGASLPPLPASDLALLADDTWMGHLREAGAAMFAWGLEGYADDRIADGPGWATFDVEAIRCPVIVLHGGADVITHPIHARHTAEIVPTAELRLVDGLGHLSVEPLIPAAVADLLARSQ
jgi:pimeloyl-ACP methyl ester carboxylesterase